MKRLLNWMFGPKVFGCGCGKQFRDEQSLARHMWKHALEG